MIKVFACAMLLSALGAAGAQAQAPPAPVAFVAAPELQAQVAAMAKEVSEGKSFVYRPVLRAGASLAALEYWTKPRPPAVHVNDAEYVVVIAGAGTLVSGGTMADSHETKPGQLEGSRIVGGDTRELHVGDVFMVPAGVPHWFDIHGERLVLLGSKLPQPK